MVPARSTIVSGPASPGYPCRAHRTLCESSRAFTEVPHASFRIRFLTVAAPYRGYEGHGLFALKADSNRSHTSRRRCVDARQLLSSHQRYGRHLPASAAAFNGRTPHNREFFGTAFGDTWLAHERRVGASPNREQHTVGPALRGSGTAPLFSLTPGDHGRWGLIQND